MKSSKLMVLFILIVCFHSKNGAKQLAAFPNALVTLVLDGKEIYLGNVNSKGEYSIQLNCNSNYKIVARASNFFKSDFTFKTSSKNNKNLSQNILLKNECSQIITGKVLNKLSKKNIDKAKVTLYLNDEKIESLIIHNNNNTYSFKIRCNTDYKIIASKFNFINNFFDFSTSNADNEIIEHNFILEPECIQTIKGTVINKDTKKPLSSELLLYLNNVETEIIQINDDGKFFVQFQCTTNYKIVARKINFKNDSYNFLTDYIENKQPDFYNLKKDLFLEPNEYFQLISGKILENSTNKIVPNSIVSLFYKKHKIKTFQTSSDGSYFFNIKCGYNYKLKASKNDVISETINYNATSIKGDNITQNIFLEKKECYKVFKGLVVNEKSKLPLAGIQITLYKENNEINNTISNSKGTFSFNLKCGFNYKIEAKRYKYHPTSISFITYENSTISLNKTVELKPIICKQIVNGTVYDRNTNLTLANTTVFLMKGTSEIKKVTTENNGRFSFKINCEANYKLIANNANYTIESATLATNTIQNTVNIITFNLIKKVCNQTVTGIIRDKITKKPLPNTTITLYQNDKVVDTYTVGNNGVYKFKLDCSSNYQLAIFKNNYLESSNLKTFSQHNRTLNLNFDIEPLVCMQYIYGMVKENITNNPITNTKVILINNSKEIKQTLTNLYGEFYFKIDCDKKYTLTTKKLNFTKAEYALISTNKNTFSHNVDLVLEPIISFIEKKGIKYIETKPIIFELDTYKINDIVKVELNKIVFNMLQNPLIKIEINYYTGSRGPDAYNLQLTINRANATKEYLISKGINPNRIKAAGFGETKLLNKCKNNVKCSEAEHALNRRTEFIVTKK